MSADLALELQPIGADVEATGTVIVAQPADSKFHPSTLVIATLDDGTRVKAFVKAESDLGGAKVGELWTITGRVKKHEVVGGTPQTVLNRAKGWEPDDYADDNGADLAYEA